jgi:hypothetical protein
VIKTAILVAVALARAAWAQPAITVQPASADWTGHYQIARGKALGGLQPISPDLNQVVTAHLQPWARLKMEGTDGVADDTGQVCQPIGIFRYAIVNSEFMWLPGRDHITIASWEINTVGARRIYLNRPHLKNVAPTWNGDSVGHWEGDTLVVDTIGFNDKSWLHMMMQPHSEDTHLIERIRRITTPSGAYMEVRGKVEDRQALTSAFEYSRYYKQSSEEMVPNVCSEDIGTWKEIRDRHLRPLMERAREVK